MSPRNCAARDKLPRAQCAAGLIAAHELIVKMSRNQSRFNGLIKLDGGGLTSRADGKQKQKTPLSDLSL